MIVRGRRNRAPAPGIHFHCFGSFPDETGRWASLTLSRVDRLQFVRGAVISANIMRPLVCILSVVAFANSLFAGLSWEQKEISIVADPFDDAATAVYRFTNDGDVPITIADVQTSCGCTVPSLSKDTYLPGESGEITATFTFGGRIGEQHKTITVVTDETGANSTALKLEVEIPELFEVRPQFVVWRKSDEPSPKSISIINHFPDRIRLVSVESQDKRFEARLETAEDEPGAHKIVITPSETNESAQARIIVKSDQSGENPRVITLYALVR